MNHSEQNDSDDDLRQRNKGAKEDLASYETRLAELAQQAVAGAQEVDVALSTLLEGVPDSTRSSIVARFRELCEELEQDRAITPMQELTPEQELQLLRIREHEEMLVAFRLSKATLEKIRRAFMMDATLFQRVINAGQELAKRGVFYDARRPQVSSSELGAVTTHPTLPPAKDKEKDTGKGKA